MIPELESTLSDTTDLIATNLKATWLYFGPGDFPSDAGVEFRNHFIQFPLAFREELRTPVTGDDWVPTNAPLLAKITHHQLVRVIGILHFYITGWDACEKLIHLTLFHQSLDWISNTYNFSPEASTEWFELAKNNRAPLGFPAGQQKMHTEIAAIIGSDPRDDHNAKGWSGCAWIARHSYKFNIQSHNKWCREVFDES